MSLLTLLFSNGFEFAVSVFVHRFPWPTDNILITAYDFSRIIVEQAIG